MRPARSGADEPGRVGQVAVEVRVFLERVELVVNPPCRAEFGPEAAERVAYGPALAHAVVDVVPRLTDILGAMLRGYGGDGA
ncbi:hypothetical protein ACH4PU_14060 [Streptomyces sp. NPDC021100]|uniref:hypothetical protein n=1 Tax=Streptomyces sp. NPDC021100 TaxID=3365114 RepID=UPI0037B013EE